MSEGNMEFMYPHEGGAEGEDKGEKVTRLSREQAMVAELREYRSKLRAKMGEKLIKIFVCRDIEFDSDFPLYDSKGKGLRFNEFVITFQFLKENGIGPSEERFDFIQMLYECGISNVVTRGTELIVSFDSRDFESELVEENLKEMSGEALVARIDEIEQEKIEIGEILLERMKAKMKEVVGILGEEVSDYLSIHEEGSRFRLSLATLENIYDIEVTEEIKEALKSKLESMGCFEEIHSYDDPTHGYTVNLVFDLTKLNA